MPAVYSLALALLTVTPISISSAQTLDDIIGLHCSGSFNIRLGSGALVPCITDTHAIVIDYTTQFRRANRKLRPLIKLQSNEKIKKRIGLILIGSRKDHGYIHAQSVYKNRIDIAHLTNDCLSSWDYALPKRSEVIDYADHAVFTYSGNPWFQTGNSPTPSQSHLLNLPPFLPADSTSNNSAHASSCEDHSEQ